MDTTNPKVLLKKTMTKKELKAYYNAARSQVGMGRKLGTCSMMSARDYRRTKMKKELKEILMDN